MAKDKKPLVPADPALGSLDRRCCQKVIRKDAGMTAAPNPDFHAYTQAVLPFHFHKARKPLDNG